MRNDRINCCQSLLLKILVCNSFSYYALCNFILVVLITKKKPFMLVHYMHFHEGAFLALSRLVSFHIFLSLELCMLNVNDFLL